MNEMVQQLREARRRGESVAFTALVETRGSTPQKAGATMLVFSDGSQVGTLGGGCVEAEVKRRALHLLEGGDREILTFQLDSDYGWDDGLICGGRMRMLVDPVRPEQDFSYFEKLEEFRQAGRPCTEAVVFDPEKSSGGAAADRYLLDGMGEIVARRAIASEPPHLKPYYRSIESRPRPYVSGGISFLPRLGRCRLVIVGGGHVGQRVAELAHQVDFDVWVLDDREQYCNSERFPQARRLIVGEIGPSLSSLDVDFNTYCLIVTRGHHHDEEALYHLAETKACYVGMIGSKRKIKLIFEDLLREGISREALRRVFAPLGFEIGSQTVPEIAVSIVAELIAHRNLPEIPPQYRKTSLVDEISDSIDKTRLEDPQQLENQN